VFTAVILVVVVVAVFILGLVQLREDDEI